MTPRDFRGQARRRTAQRRLAATCVTKAYVRELVDLTSLTVSSSLTATPLRTARGLVLSFAFDERAFWDGAAWKVEYRYTILARDGREVLSFHHHLGRPPHLHLGAGAGELFDPLYKAHIPTGAITFGDVVRMLITDFDVQPRRADWDHVLETAAQPAG